MAANPLIASAASLLVPWKASETVTCHCRRCDNLLAIAPNLWASSGYPYLYTPSSICVFDNSIICGPLSESQPTEEGQHLSIVCKHCLETVGYGVQKTMFKDEFPQFKFFWSSHSIGLRDITSRAFTPSRFDGVMNASCLGSSGPDTYESSSLQQQTNGPSNNNSNEGVNLHIPSAKPVSDEITEWRQTISSLQDKIRYLTTAISSLNQTPQVPHDGYELIATALREVRAKGIEIETLKQENHSLRLKSKQLENMPLMRIDHTSTLSNGPFTASPDADTSQIATSDQRARPLALCSSRKRPVREEIPLATNDRNSQLSDAERSQRTSNGHNLATIVGSRLAYSSQPIPVASEKGRPVEATNSDTDELAQPRQVPKYQKLSANVNCSEQSIPSNAASFPKISRQYQELEPSQASRENPAQTSKRRKRKSPVKTFRGRPKTKPLQTTASTTKVPLKKSDEIIMAPQSPAPTGSVELPMVGESLIQDKPEPTIRARRASARLSRRSSLAPDHENTPQPITELNQALSAESPTLPIQVSEVRPSPPHSKADIEVPWETIPNSQSDSDNASLYPENSHPVGNEQTGELAQKTSKSQNIRDPDPDPAREKRKSQIAARDSLAKLAMQREEALEVTIH
ncbi:hypothetical protein ACJ72_02625 [Emergomyces africanus]|uniref:Mis18 domain-containing protein n=1 Tax=Emergomyces africanus TaxID=1955775 RepID=A0A1B7P1Y1_9EURO|nr:hypothetical protein ACJ72_02625 [Emergomyces africanus]